MRSQLLSSATRRFAAQGFEATALQAIADDVGVAKQSLLHHFPSKEALRRAVLEQMLTHWNDQLPRLLLASAGEDRFVAITAELLRFFTEDPDRARLVLRECLDRPDEMRALLSAYVRPWLSTLGDYIRKGQRHGEHHGDVDPEAYVLSVVQLVVSGVALSQPFAAALDGPSPQARYLAEVRRVAHAALFSPQQVAEKQAAPKTPAQAPPAPPPPAAVERPARATPSPQHPVTRQRKRARS